MLRTVRTAFIALTTSVTITACAGPVGQNTAQSLASEQRQAQQIVQQLDAKGKLYRDPQLQSYLNQVVARVASTRPRGAVPIRAYIIKDADVNAFTLGGGYLFFNAGMLAALENEAQLATVAAHEIAHIDRGHVQASRSNRNAIQIGAVLATIGAAAAGIDPNTVKPLVGLGATAIGSNFSRTQESDADLVGVRYVARAGYDVDAGAESFAVLRRLYGNSRGAPFLASHPPPANRQAVLNQQAVALRATSGRVGEREHDAATRDLRRQVLEFYDRSGRQREAAQIRRNLR